MPSLEPTAPPSRKRAPEPDPIAEKIQARLAELRASEVNPEDAVEQGLLAILETTDVAAGAICLYDPRQQILRLAAERGLSDQGCRSLRHIRRGYAGAWDMPLQSLSNRRVYLIENASQNRYVPPLIDEQEKMRTVLCLPLLTGNTPVGSLIIVSTARKPFSDQDVVRLEAPGRELAIIIESARARARQAERAATTAPPPDQPYRARSNAENLIGQRFNPDQELINARQLAADWERKHQELAGELAAATAREQRLRDELTAAAERLQEFSQSTRGRNTKDEAAHLAQNARLQASLAEAEAIAARERMRAAECERKLAEMAELLSSATAREEALRQLAEKEHGDGDPARRKEFIDQSLEIARLNARLADAEAALTQARNQAAANAGAAAAAAELAEAREQLAAREQALEASRAELESKLQAQQAAFDAQRERLEARAAELEASLAEARQTAQTVESELAAVRAREQALAEELEAATAQYKRLLSEAEERERQREQARSGEVAQLQSALHDANEAVQRANERLAALEQRYQDVAGQLAATSTREQALREELESSARAQQARTIELEALLEHERSLVADWQRKHQELDAEYRQAMERERQRLAEDLRRDETTAAEELDIELRQLRERLAEVEANAARDAGRAADWEERCATLTSQLDDVVARNAVIDRELGELR
ncbi:MAG TPA: GAF domain-containing protein, partial [Candidatus Limnocylindria bacterium]|nr:GAF domain-containing protein [Candidatus Limnocylindria bacterium]